MVYQWRNGFNTSGDAQAVGAAIARIADIGMVQPEAVVEAARVDDGELHAQFDWDDASAAAAHRVYTARNIIGALVIVVETQDEQPKPVMRAFVNVRSGELRGYVKLDVAMTNDDYRVQVLQRARAEMLAWRRRYFEYQELAEMVAAIDRMVAALPELETV